MLNLHYAGLPVHNGKIVISKIGVYFEGKKRGTDAWVKGNDSTTEWRQQTF